MTVKLVGATPVQVCFQPFYGKKGATKLLANLDITKTVNIGDSPTVGVNDDQLPPLGTLGVDGERDVWAVSPGGPVLVQVIEHGTSWQASPAQIAEQIAASGLALDTSVQAVKGSVNTVNGTLGTPAQTGDVGALHAAGKTIAGEAAQTGIPLLRFANAVASGSGGVGPAGTVTLISAQVLDQPSFQCILDLTQVPTGVTIPFGRLRMVWEDSASGFSLPPDYFVLPAGLAAACAFMITGPARFDTLTIFLDNLDPAEILSYNFALTQVSHVYDKMRVQEANNTTVPDLTRGGSAPQLGVLGSVGASIPATSNIQRLATTWAGAAILTCDNSGASLPVIVRLLDPGVALGGSPLYGVANSGVVAAVELGAAAAESIEVALPNGPVVIEEVNNGASAIQPTTTLVRIDQ